MDKPRVKPLEWNTITSGRYETAERFGMIYGVSRARDGIGWVADASPRWSSERDEAKFDERDLAYDWCEDHNETRILTALEPVTVQKAREGALREAADIARHSSNTGRTIAGQILALISKDKTK